MREEPLKEMRESTLSASPSKYLLLLIEDTPSIKPYPQGGLLRGLKRNLSYRKAVKLIGPPEKCSLCGFVFPEELKKPMSSVHTVPHQPTIGHIIPRSKGGSDDPINLRWECFICNNAKGDKLDGPQV